MNSLLEVQCPHCNAKGQIEVPPVGAVIIGPCPHCQEYVVVFCGQTLALDKTLMTDAPIDERREHLLGVMNDFLRERISSLLTEEMGIESVSPVDDLSDFDADEDSFEFTEIVDAKIDAEISQTEVDQFMDVDLKLLDNRAYFNSVFGNPS